MTTSKHISHDELKEKLLQDPAVLNAYNELDEEYQLLREMLKARKRAGMSQEKVAKAMRTTASTVSRLETLSKNRPSPSFKTLNKYARAVGCDLVFKLKPKNKDKVKNLTKR